MSSIVKHYNKKTGTTYVYESTPHYDPVLKQSRPVRKYLGVLDPQTNELIPSSGHRGRRPSGNKPESAGDQKALQERLSSLKETEGERDREIADLKAEVYELKLKVKNYERIFGTINRALNSAPEKMKETE